MTIGILEKLGFRSSKSKKSKNVAKERLQFILVQDRIKLSSDEMESLRKDMLEVLTKYVDVDESQMKMEVDRHEGMTALVANFPIKKSG